MHNVVKKFLLADFLDVLRSFYVYMHIIVQFSRRGCKMVVKVNLELVARDAVRAVKRKDIIVVIDVLRCSSSILNAFANGAKEVIPTKTLSEA